jgi:hypothetical protein
MATAPKVIDIFSIILILEPFQLGACHAFHLVSRIVEELSCSDWIIELADFLVGAVILISDSKHLSLFLSDYSYILQRFVQLVKSYFTTALVSVVQQEHSKIDYRHLDVQ